MASASKKPLILLGLLTLTAACTVQSTKTPGLTGPSELALSIVMTATPDSISRDGASQSSLIVLARDENAKPVAGLPIRLDMVVAGFVQDFGTLSARNVVTGADGRAIAVYTAPLPPPPGVSGSVTLLDVIATPSGANFQTARTHTVTIRLVPQGVFLPPGPTPRFTFSPSTPAANAPVQFDASTSCGSPVAPGAACPSSGPSIVSYAWNFGDGDTAIGRSTAHVFAAQQTYGVTLTVTTDAGGSASATVPIAVGAGALPVADFVISPTSVAVGVPVNFNGDLSRPGAGHQIVEWLWNFGDGQTASGVAVSKPTPYTRAGTYSVTLTVVDESGQRHTVSKTLSVS